MRHSPAARSSEIRHSLRDELTWTHYRLPDAGGKARSPCVVFERGCRPKLEHPRPERQINSALYYERLKMSHDKKPVVKEM